jgi:hypothetical protein
VHSPTRSAGPCPRHSTVCPASRDLGLGEEGKWKVGQSATTRDQVCPWADWTPLAEGLQPYQTWVRRLTPFGVGFLGEVVSCVLPD